MFAGVVDLSGRVALVSGSSRGIGKGIARALLRAGARVYLNGRDEASLRAAAEDLMQATGKDTVTCIVGDFTRTSMIQKSLARIQERGAAPDIVVANIGSGRSVPGPVVDDDEWQRMLELNLHGAVRLCREAIQCMPAGGSFTAISSIAGRESIGAPVPYTVAKAGLLAFVRATADLVAERGIRVNAVSPGNVLFEGGVWEQKLQDDQVGVLKMLEQQVPMNDFASCEDIGAAVAFLASAEARFITGANLVVDGGQLRGLAG